MSLINGVIAQKLQSLDTTLLELGSLGTLNIEQLAHDWSTKRAVERSLQILVEIVIDICQRLIALSGQSPGTTGRDAIERTIHMGVISNDDHWFKMAQFRSFIVHRYEPVDNAILVDMANRHLSDFAQFRNEVLAYVRRITAGDQATDSR